MTLKDRIETLTLKNDEGYEKGTILGSNGRRKRELNETGTRLKN